MGPVVSEKIFFLLKMYMLSWQQEFQSNLPKNNMQPFLLLSDAVCVQYFDQDLSTGFGDIDVFYVFL